MASFDELPNDLSVLAAVDAGIWSQLDQHRMAEARHALYVQAYNELCKAVTGEEPKPIPPPESEFVETVKAFLRKNHKRVDQKICKEFDYCAKMKRYKWGILSIPLLIAMIAFFTDAIGAGGASSATWLYIKRILDEFCNCNAITPTGGAPTPSPA